MHHLNVFFCDLGFVKLGEMRIILGICLAVGLFCGCNEDNATASSGDFTIRQLQNPRRYIGEFWIDSLEGYFVECQSQMEYPIVGGPEENLLKKTYISMGERAGAHMLAEFDGYLAQRVRIDSAEMDQVLMVNELVHLDPIQDCRDVGGDIMQDSLFVMITREMENISYMYEDSVTRAESIRPDTPLDILLSSEPMQLAFQAFLMAKGGLSRREVMEQEASLQTVLDVYKLFKRRKDQE